MDEIVGIGVPIVILGLVFMAYVFKICSICSKDMAAES